jgi:hypothetical protein
MTALQDVAWTQPIDRTWPRTGSAALALTQTEPALTGDERDEVRGVGHRWVESPLADLESAPAWRRGRPKAWLVFGPEMLGGLLSVRPRSSRRMARAPRGGHLQALDGSVPGLRRFDQPPR